ncbi:unnamed protein product, partial [Amoebophrya sp. A25]|eukprot:GSA25T00013988001.1
MDGEAAPDWVGDELDELRYMEGKNVYLNYRAAIEADDFSKVSTADQQRVSDTLDEDKITPENLISSILENVDAAEGVMGVSAKVFDLLFYMQKRHLWKKQQAKKKRRGKLAEELQNMAEADGAGELCVVKKTSDGGTVIRPQCSKEVSDRVQRVRTEADRQAKKTKKETDRKEKLARKAAEKV